MNSLHKDNHPNQYQFEILVHLHREHDIVLLSYGIGHRYRLLHSNRYPIALGQTHVNLQYEVRPLNIFYDM